MLQPDSTEEFKRVIETALLAAPAPLPVGELRRLFEEDPGSEVVRAALLELADDWQGRGVELVQTAGGWRFQTRLKYQVYLDRLKQERPPKYSRAVLETLAIIAYRQPITRPEVDLLRGVNSGGVVTSLLEKGLVRIKGRKDAPGRPFLLETTAHFLSSFGLKDLSDLPKVDLPEIGTGADAPKVLGEALEELSTTTQEEESSEAQA